MFHIKYPWTLHIFLASWIFYISLYFFFADWRPTFTTTVPLNPFPSAITKQYAEYQTIKIVFPFQVQQYEDLHRVFCRHCGRSGQKPALYMPKDPKTRLWRWWFHVRQLLPDGVRVRTFNSLFRWMPLFSFYLKWYIIKVTHSPYCTLR